MKILSLHIDGFGKFHDRDISFEDGLNVVYGKNEAGKSTLHTFIKGMLFGIERQRGRASKNDTYSKFQPWTQSGVYEGFLRVECDGEVYRIERRFQKGDKRLCVINETSGKEEENTTALLDKLRCGLSETAYDNTISIGQLKCATDGGMVSELRNYIANLNTSGSIALNITKASAYLKNQRKQLEAHFVPEAAKSYANILGEIRKIEQEISAPEYANHLTARRQEKGQLKNDLDKKQKEKEVLLEKAAKGRQILVNSQFENQASVEKYTEEARKHYQDYNNALEACSKHSRTIGAVFLFLMAVPGLASGLFLLLFPKYCHFPAFRICAPVFTAFWISYKDPCFISHSLRYPVCCSRQYATCPAAAILKSSWIQKPDSFRRSFQSICRTLLFLKRQWKR